ncbi:hypothetical protein GCM10027275_10520 [Rhabdobacter roseus]|uniref:Serine/threonine protein kinase n=1 Tax=Rhabdobacter roseus TaxID=1655419 RepID=A0A840TI29_9BACT|nr:protein kinase [Rhabdobacter roseus]MBB5282961.1 serine/threonine protein kinase [Rhabdobacter roseus]
MKFESKRIILSEDADKNLLADENFIEHEGGVYFLHYLNEKYKNSKGGNSSVFTLSPADEPQKKFVIKICNYHRPSRNAHAHIIRRHGRFIEEIKVLRELKEKGRENIVSILFDGSIRIDGRDFPYYVMEKADCDLKEYMFANSEIDNQEKVKFCVNIFQALSDLHKEGYYHRDIKPDNIFLFFIGDTEKEKAIWKIGDLGLAAHRDKDYDDLGEKIGPFGWLSPEAMNKFLTEEANIGFDCRIDDKSDIFQLGKLFWFIFQRNVPIGQLELDDFLVSINHKEIIFELLKEMLRYSKVRRINREVLGSFMAELQRSFAV